MINLLCKVGVDLTFDTIKAPEGYFERISLQHLFGLYYPSVKRAYRKKLGLGSLSFVFLLSFSLMITQPFATTEASVKSAQDSAQIEEININSSGKIDAESPVIKGYEQIELLDPIPMKDKAAQLIVERGTFDSVYHDAEKIYGVPWELLGAVHYIESGQSGDTSRVSSAGALGPMQFMPATFEAYKQDGDGDGVISIYDVHDAIYSAAKNLAANGVLNGNVRKALYNYNHSDAYVEKVLDYARRLGYQI
jgi:hypothetical protein